MPVELGWACVAVAGAGAVVVAVFVVSVSVVVVVVVEVAGLGVVVAGARPVRVITQALHFRGQDALTYVPTSACVQAGSSYVAHNGLSACEHCGTAVPPAAHTRCGTATSTATAATAARAKPVPLASGLTAVHGGAIPPRKRRGLHTHIPHLAHATAEQGGPCWQGWAGSTRPAWDGLSQRCGWPWRRHR